MKPLVVGRGPWAQNIFRTLDELGVPYTVVGKQGALDAIHHAPANGNTHVIVSTPLATHYDLAYDAVMQGLPTMVEKPLGTKLTEVQGLELAWRERQPKFLCDSVHLFAQGAERMREWAMGLTKTLKPPDWVSAAFGGPGPERSDCHYLWDYGWHPLSLLYSLGVHLFDWTFDDLDDVGIAFSKRVPVPGYEDLQYRYSANLSNKWPNKATSFIATWGEDDDPNAKEWDLNGSKWMFGQPGADPSLVFDMKDSPPLKRALKLFLDDEHDWKNDYRFGFELPLAVTRCLESMRVADPSWDARVTHRDDNGIVLQTKER